MRILRIHNRYQIRGGEESVFESEVELLRAKGEDVTTIEVSNDEFAEITAPREKLNLAFSTVWSRRGRNLVADAIQNSKPDVVHFDNTFPIISPAAYSVAKDAGLAVVQSLYNFRLLCPNGLFYRDNRPCEDCLGRTPPIPGVVHGCYRGSRAQTAVVAGMLTTHRLRRTWSREVDRFIVQSNFSRGKFLEGGLPSDRVVVKPNFVNLPTMQAVGARGPRFVYVGRLSEEKGIQTMLDAWRRYKDLPDIDVIGDGPMFEYVKRESRSTKSINVVGRLPREEVLFHLQSAVVLVFPSGCYENFPVTIAEAFACGLPVIASNHGAMSEIVENGRTGLHFNPGDVDDLANKVQWAASHPEEMSKMGACARLEYEQNYTPEQNYEILMDIYEQAISSSRNR